jgi:hypothetical protein
MLFGVLIGGFDKSFVFLYRKMVEAASKTTIITKTNPIFFIILTAKVYLIIIFLVDGSVYTLYKLIHAIWKNY